MIFAIFSTFVLASSWFMFSFICNINAVCKGKSKYLHQCLQNSHKTYLSNNLYNAPNYGIQNICQDTLMRKLTCKTLMEILPTEVFLSSSKSYNHNEHDRHFQWVIIYNLDHNHHFRDQLEPVAKSKLQVVGKIQKEMAEKKLTSDFETVPDTYRHNDDSHHHY